MSKLFKGKEGATAAFTKIDADGDGVLSKNEFMAVMAPSAGFATSFSSSSNTTYVKKSSCTTMKSSFSSSSMKMSSSSSSQQTYVSTSKVEYSSSSSSSFSSSSVSFSSATDVKRAFRQFDANGDGHLDRNEFKQLLASSGKKVSDQEAMALFSQGDVDGDGVIDINEFVRLMFPAANTALAKLQQQFKNLNEVKGAFRRFDTDGDGHISRNELRQVMGSFSDAEVDAVFSLGDKDQSGAIDYQEFIAMMVPNTGAILKRIASQFNSISAVKEGFKRFDANGDGALSQNELLQGLQGTGVNFDSQECNNVFAMADLNQDGEISMVEYISA